MHFTPKFNGTTTICHLPPSQANTIAIDASLHSIGECGIIGSTQFRFQIILKHLDLCQSYTDILWYQELFEKFCVGTTLHHVCTMIFCISSTAVVVTHIYMFTKLPLSRILLVAEVCYIQPKYRKSHAAEILSVADLSFHPLFKTKLG